MYSIETVVRQVKGQTVQQKMVFGTGRITSDPPEIQEVKGGYKVLRGKGFSIAFNNGKDKPATFFPLQFWNKQAENFSTLGFKGQLVELRGRLEKVTYKDKEGKDREYEILVVEQFDVKEYKNSKNRTQPKNEGNSDNDKNAEEKNEFFNPFDAVDEGIVDINDDDLPF